MRVKVRQCALTDGSPDVETIVERWVAFVEFVSSPRGPFQVKSKLGAHEETAKLAVLAFLRAQRGWELFRGI